MGSEKAVSIWSVLWSVVGMWSVCGRYVVGIMVGSWYDWSVKVAGMWSVLWLAVGMWLVNQINYYLLSNEGKPPFSFTDLNTQGAFAKSQLQNFFHYKEKQAKQKSWAPTCIAPHIMPDPVPTGIDSDWMCLMSNSQLCPILLISKYSLPQTFPKIMNIVNVLEPKLQNSCPPAFISWNSCATYTIQRWYNATQHNTIQ